MSILRSALIVGLVLFLPAAAVADGLIHTLPEDGSWARFNMEGEAIGSDGQVQVTVKGTFTIRSVGQVKVDDKPCRWIEIETGATFEGRGRKQDVKEIHKLLIPEDKLTRDENPRDHVQKAWKKDANDRVTEIDRTQVQSLDEWFHPPSKSCKELELSVIETKQGKLECEGMKCRDSMGNDGGRVVFTTELWTHKNAPFGVVKFFYEKERLRDERSNGKRNTTLTLDDFGKDAKSAIPEKE